MVDPSNEVGTHPLERRRDVAGRNAEAQAQKTVNRLTQGIAALSARSTPVTAKTIERETGLSYRTITRNAAAYVLFCKHAAYFQANTPSKVETATANKRALKRRKPASTPWDPLWGQTKKKLAERLRAAQERVRELELALGQALST